MFFFINSAWSQIIVKKTFFDNEKTQIRELISLNGKDSTLEGKYQAFYQNGSLSTKGHYHKNLSDSTWIFFFENGNKKATGKYEHGIQSGKWSYFFENGNKKAEGILDKNIKEGTWLFYFENGGEKSSGKYHNGKKQGIWNYFFEEGSLKAQAYYEQGNGSYKEFYPSGALKMEGQNFDEKSEGDWTYYHESGEKEAEGAFKYGLRDGKWKYYHVNGQIAAEGLFASGEKIGVWKYFYEDGSVNAEGTMKNDQKDGFWKLYYPSGIVKGEGRYDLGTGEYIEFYENGKQKAKGALMAGKKQDKWIYYSEDGVEDGYAFFENGIGDYQGFYHDGTIKMKGQLEDDRRVGEWSLFNPDGTLAGVYRPVYENDKPIFRTSESLQVDAAPSQNVEKPEYKYKNNQSRYFTPRVNEFRGYILATNPLWTVVGKLPVSFEYYYQERLGYETELTFHNSPFFRQAKIDEMSTKGGTLAFKQKFYNNDTDLGLFYFGHQLSVGYLLHHVTKIDSSNISAPFEIDLNATESRFSYGVLIGNRWMKRAGNAGPTVDFHFGIAIAARNFQKEYATSLVNEGLFKNLNQDRVYVPIIFGINIGFSGPKRPTTSF
jgi:uncharacterized protein